MSQSRRTRDAKITALQPPPIDKSRQFLGLQLPRLGQRAKRPCGTDKRSRSADRAANATCPANTEGLPQAPQINLVIDREKAGAFGISFEDINNIISTNLGSTYVNDFRNIAAACDA